LKKLSLIGISKYFPGVKALEDIHFELRAGEVHALCGENGAGKSTLMNILTGNLQPNAGQIVLNGEPVEITGPGHAAHLGIAIVYQTLSLVEPLTVAENIFANTQPRTRWGLIDYRSLYKQTQELLHSLRMDGLHPQAKVAELSPGQRQMVEIAKALSKHPDILILDEPTASISERETQTLFQIIRQLKAQGKSVIYISHRMKEIFAIADRVTVLKDGHYQGTHPISEVTTNDLIRMMVGRELTEQATHSFATGEKLLEVKGLAGPAFQDVSFTLHRGEILGLAGLVGAGRSEIAQTIFGYLPRQAGQVLLRGREVAARHPAEAIAAGIGYVPEERKAQGLFLDKTVADNIILSNLRAAAPGQWYKESLATRLAMGFKEKLRIVTPNVEQKVINLSGGNQQKVVLAKWLLVNPDVLIVDEPTHGIDVGAKAEIYGLLRQLAAEGKGILLISSELPELLTLADRILVIREGQVSGELPGRQTTEEEIMALATV
jgi:ABC-type sugar transport system ATPase subunit